MMYFMQPKQNLKPCEEVINLSDAIFAILDTEMKELSIIVTSGY